MIRIGALLLTLILAGGLSAQLVRTLGVQGSGNAFPFNFTTSGRFQSSYGASDLTIPANATITEIRVFGSTVTPATYGNLRCRLGHSTLAVNALTTTFDTNYTGTLTTCLGPANFSPTATAATGGSWYSFPFTTPFTYNGTDNLLVDWSFDTKTGTGFTISTSTPTGGEATRSRVYLSGGNHTSPTASSAPANGGNYGIQFVYLPAGNSVLLANQSPTSVSLGASATDLVIMDFLAHAFSTAQALNAITFTKVGTVPDASISNVKLVNDLNNNGVVDGTDAVLGSSTLTAGAVTFSGSPLVSVPTSGPVRLLLAFSYPSPLPGGATISFSVANASAVTWSGGTDFTSYPLNSGNFVVRMSGNYTIAQSGTPDFASIGAAFDALEANGVSGAVTLTITDSATYTSTPAYSLGCDATGASVINIAGLSAANSITLRAGAGQSPKIQSSSTGAVLIGQSSTSPLIGRGGLVINASYVTVEGLEVFGGPDFGIMAQGNNIAPFNLNTTDITIRRCKVHDIPSGPGIAFMGQNSGYATNILIENNFVWNCFTASGNPTTSTVLLNNTGGSITLRNAASASGIVRHNTILHTSSFGGLTASSVATGGIYAYSSSSTFALNNISNNIVVCTNASVAAIFLNSATSNPTPANCNFNCWFSTVFCARASAAVSFATWQTEGRDLAGTTANPQLVSTTSPFDLHLQSSSPCINVWGQTSTVTTDIDGDTRPQGSSADCGADESLTQPSAQLSVFANTAAPAQALKGAGDQWAGSFTARSLSSTQQLSSLTLNQVGTVANTEVTSLKLWADTNGNNALDGSDTQLASTVGALSGSSVTFTGSPLQSFTNDQQLNLFISVQLTAAAATGATVRFQITASSDLTTSPGPVTGGFPVAGSTLVVASPEINWLRGATAVADGGTDTVSGFVISVASTITYTIQNTGNSPLTLTNPATISNLSGCTVTITTAPAGSVAASGSATTVLTVTPSAAAFSFDYSLANSDLDENPYNFTVNGTAAAANPELNVLRGATAVADGGMDSVSGFVIGTASSLTYTFSNAGNAAVTLTNPATLGSQTNCTVTITTAPAATINPASSTTTVLSVNTSAASFSFTYSIGNNDANENPYDWTINGTAVAPNPELDVLRGTTAVADGGADAVTGIIGVAGSITYTFSNTGNVAVTLTNPATIGSQSNCTVTITTVPAASINPASTTTTVLSVTPSASPYSFTYSIGNNDANENPYDWTVNGTALSPFNGTYVINKAGGMGVAYTDIGAAFDDLELVGVSGATIFEIYDDGGAYASTASYQLGGDGTTTDDVPGLSAANTLTFRAASGESPVITGAGAGNGFSATGLGTISSTNLSFVTFQGLEIVGTATGNWGILGYSGVAQSTYNIIGCKIRGIGAGAGIVFYGNSATTNDVVIRNNFVWACSGDGGTVLSSGVKGVVGSRRCGTNWTIEHNTIVHINGAAGSSVFFNNGNTTAIANLRNNVVYLSNASAVPYFRLDTSAVLPTAAGCNRNVIFLGGACTMSTDTLNDTWTEWQTNGRDVNGLNTDPLLTSIATGTENLHLTSSSPAIDLALGSTVTVDIDGDTRPVGANPDAGADEFNSSSVAPTITSASPANGVLGTAYSHTFTATGFPATFAWTITTGSLPPGLTLNASSGVMSGNPTASGNYVFTVNCSNGINPDANQNVNMNINQAPSFTSSAPASGLIGAAYSHTFTASGFPATFTFTVSSGALPSGLTLNSGTGVLSGTPTVSGNFNFNVSCSNGVSPNAGQGVSLNIIEAPLFTSSAPPNGNVGVAYNHTCTASGFPTSFTFTVTSGALPGGLSLNSTTGDISGTPSASGTFNGVITVSNGISPNDTQNFSIQIAAAAQPPAISSGAPPNGVVGTAYSHTFTASGNPAVFTWTVISGTLPAGLTLNASSGVLSGTPTTAGAASFTVNCANGISPDDSQNVNMNINQAPTITSAAPPNGTFGAAYSHTFTATGFPASFTWTVISGALPGGLSLNGSSGVLSGSPTVSGAFSFTVQCSNGVSPNATQPVNMNINRAPTITSGAPANGIVGTAYTHTFTATGFPASFTWSLVSGTLPGGLTLNTSSGVLSGTPTASGAFNFTIGCANGISPNANQVVNMNVNQAPSITSAAPANATFGAVYSHTFTATGFPATFTWTISAGTLPGGLTLNGSSGVLSGTPTASGAFTFTVQCANGVSPNANQVVNMNVNRAPTITSAAPGNGVVGTSYSHTFTATGFPATFTWTVSAGALPAGLTLNASSGALTGTPTASGAQNFTVTCSNGISPDAGQVVNMNVNQAPAISSAAPPDATLGAPYTHTFTATGFPATFTWSVSAGTLPAGLTLNTSTGVLSGTAATAGAATFTVTVSNGISPNANQNVNMNVTQGPSITSTAPANGVVGVSYSHTFTATGVPATFTWTVSAGSLPAGLTLAASTGVLSGTPTSAGAATFTVNCSNGTAPDAVQNVNMTINQAPTITSAAPPAGATFTAYNHTCMATGLPATFTWSVSAGALPAGITLNGTTGVLSGTPTAGGTFNGMITCSNGISPDATQAFSINISNTPVPDMAVMRGTVAVTDAGTDALGSMNISLTQNITYTIVNNGTSALNLTGAPSLVVTGSPVNVASLTASSPATSTLAPSASTTFTVSFVVPATGAFGFTLSIDNNDPHAGRNPYDWTVSGTGVSAPEMDVSRGATAVADGGSALLGSPVAGFTINETFTITNNGTSPLSITGAVTPQNVSNCMVAISASPSPTVAAGASTTFTVTITGGAAGPYSFALSIVNNDPNENPYNWTNSGVVATPGGSKVGGGSGGGGCSSAEASSWLFAAMALLLGLKTIRRKRA